MGGQRGPREGIFGYGHDGNYTSGVMDKGCKGRRVPGYNGIIQNRSAVRDHTDYNKTELHKVAQYDYEYVGVYLTCGADPNVRDDNHWTPLHAAADYGNYEAVKLLIEYGANVDAQDMWNATSLNHAAQNT